METLLVTHCVSPRLVGHLITHLPFRWMWRCSHTRLREHCDNCSEISNSARQTSDGIPQNEPRAGGSSGTANTWPGTNGRPAKTWERAPRVRCVTAVPVSIKKGGWRNSSLTVFPSQSFFTNPSSPAPYISFSPSPFSVLSLPGRPYPDLTLSPQTYICWLWLYLWAQMF